MFKVDPYDKKQKEKLVALAKRLEELYREKRFLIYDVAGNGKLNSNGWFLFDDDKAISRQIDKAMKDLHDDIVKTTEGAQLDAVNISIAKNTALCGYMGIRTADDIVKNISPRSLSALNSVQNRKVAGMNLSERVWNYTNQFKQEMELVMEVGISDGIPAANMARELRQYLNEPNKLFRRVRDKETGILRLSKAAAAYHPGQGVYRSSYQNALRCAMTETNIAYRTADFENWNAFDFVIGTEIRTSQTNHTETDICDQLAGKYPKDFKFTGWHPRCRCHAIPLLKSRAEMEKDDERILNGEEPLPSKRETTQLPDNFKKWIRDNQENIEIAAAKGKLPYFVKDNKDLISGKITRPITTLEKADIRHKARTAKQINDIKSQWSERKATRKFAGKILDTMDGIKDVDTSALIAALNSGDIVNTAIEAKKLKEIGKGIKGFTNIVNPLSVAKNFSMAEAQAVNDAVGKTFARWRWDFSERNSLEFLKAKLQTEISFVEQRKKYSTWEEAKKAYEKRLALIENRIKAMDVKDSVNADLEFIAKSKSKVAMKHREEFLNILSTDGEIDIKDLEKRSKKIKEDAAKLRTAASKKSGSIPSQIKSDEEAESEFLDYMKSIGMSISEGDYKIDNGYITNISSLAHSYIFDNSKSRGKNIINSHFGGGYVRTGNSFKINGALRDVFGKGKNSIHGDIMSAENQAKAKISADRDGRMLKADDIKTIKTLDDAIKRNSLNFDALLVRNVNSDALASLTGLDVNRKSLQEIMNKLSEFGTDRELIPDPGFMSASLNPKNNVFSDRNIQLKIEIPKGSPLYISDNYIESECVLPRDTKLHVLGYELNKYNIVIRVRVIP